MKNIFLAFYFAWIGILSSFLFTWTVDYLAYFLCKRGVFHNKICLLYHENGLFWWKLANLLEIYLFLLQFDRFCLTFDYFCLEFDYFFLAWNLTIFPEIWLLLLEISLFLLEIWPILTWNMVIFGSKCTGNRQNSPLCINLPFICMKKMLDRYVPNQHVAKHCLSCNLQLCFHFSSMGREVANKPTVHFQCD